MKKGPRCTRVSDKGLGWAFLPLKSTINFLKIDYLPACGWQIPKKYAYRLEEYGKPSFGAMSLFKILTTFKSILN